MTQSNVSQELTQSFDNTSPSDSSTPCCKEVKGFWLSLKVNPEKTPFAGAPDIKEVNPDGGIFQRKIKITQKFTLIGKIKGKVLCVCADDGRKLGTKDVEKPIGKDTTFPVSYSIKPHLPYEGPLRLAKTLKEVDQVVNEAAGGDPDASDKLKELAGEKLDKQLKAMDPDTICKNAFKCAGDSKTPPAGDNNPSPGDSESTPTS
jgi:hypothetical protein